MLAMTPSWCRTAVSGSKELWRMFDKLHSVKRRAEIRTPWLIRKTNYFWSQWCLK